MTPPVDKTTCSLSGCEAEARMAISTKRPRRAKIVTTVWWDDRTAPKAAQRYCRHHGGGLLADLARMLTHPDAATRPNGEAE